MGIASRARLGQASGFGKGITPAGLPSSLGSAHRPNFSSPSATTTTTTTTTSTSTTTTLTTTLQPPAAGNAAGLLITTSISDFAGTALDTPKSTISEPSREDIIPEIIVSIDDMDFLDIGTGSSGSRMSSPPKSPAPEADEKTAPAALLQLPNMAEDAGTSLASSISPLTNQSELSSVPSSVSSKATTPADVDSSREAAASHPAAPPAKRHCTRRISHNVRPKVSIPSDMAPQDYALQCVAAAESSRLNPYALHQEEYAILREHLSHAQVTTYLNIRNGILRLWVRNPHMAVARDEAIGCAKDNRWFDVASVCFDWLVRRGYINFGCLDTRDSSAGMSGSSSLKGREKKDKRRTVAVVGAGMAGLGCARQLENLFRQYAKQFHALGEEPPRVVVLEGRNRVGGRVYSRAFKYQPLTPSPGFEETRCTAEMGGMIITGFDRGNPLNILVRGQLSLGYHALWPETTIYDVDGRPVDPVRDQLVEKLYNYFLERVSEYKFKMPASKLIEGNRDLMNEGKDSAADAHKTIAFVEETTAALPHAPTVAEQNIAPQVDLVPVSSDRLTGRTHSEPGTKGTLKAAYKARLMGWALKPGVTDSHDLDLEEASKEPGATMGSVMDEIIFQYKEIVDLNAQDYRLLNWHIANLEYSNAINYNQLSLQGWDIDAGYEWEGKHTMVVGGYQGVPRGLMYCPTPLDVRRQTPVRKIMYNQEGLSSPVQIECEGGQTIDADYVVSTIPLGVLKHGNVEFQPPLPSWKQDVIKRLGFGVLNKIILVYRKPFWDEDRDIFGVLRMPHSRFSLNQKEYASQRGRMFQWFNVSHTTGMPCLIALMAGDAAFDAEKTCNSELVNEATAVLRSVFGPAVPEPTEAVVTRWASDKFARGSYSSAGPEMRVDDYDVMARPVGNLFFAGEHTMGMYPATVHGAYLSGLRAASEVVDAILGPIDVPSPLVIPKESSSHYSLKRKATDESSSGGKDPRQARLAAYEAEIWEHVRSQIGERPFKPARVTTNAYMLFSKANFEAARQRCEQSRRPGKGGRSVPNEVRVMTSKMWKDAPAEERRPYEAQAEAQRSMYAQALRVFNDEAAEWDRRAAELRAAYERDHPSLPGPEELLALAAALSPLPLSGALPI